MIILSPYASACYNFKRTVQSEKEKVTIVIVPIKLEEHNNIIRLSWACSLGSQCANYDCEYGHKKIE